MPKGPARLVKVILVVILIAAVLLTLVIGRSW